MKNKRCIIIGSGSSIRNNQWDIPIEQLPIWNVLKEEFTIGINWSFKWIDSTIHLYTDNRFYEQEVNTLKNLPLVFCPQDGYYGREFKKHWLEIFHLHDNIYLLPASSKYAGTDAWNFGFYSRRLTGIYALNLAIALGFSEIYLLGMDCCGDGKHTHFYDDAFDAKIKDGDKLETGVGYNTDGTYKTSFYQNCDVNEPYLPFKEELKKIKIFNVSLNSKINVFQKISYEQLFSVLRKNKPKISQDFFRQEIKKLYYDKYYR